MTRVAVVAASRRRPAAGDTHSVPLATTTVDGTVPPYDVVAPGDTLLLESGTRDALTVRNLAGTVSQPIVVTDDGGVVNIVGAGQYAAIRLRNCQWMRVVGSNTQVGATPWRDGLSQTANIVTSGTQRGLSPWAGDVDEAPSEHVEFGYIEVADTTQNPGVHTSNEDIGLIPRQRDIWVHDCYVHDTVGEGLYLGASTWTVDVNGDPDPAATEVDGVAVDDCLVTDTEWDGIQVGSAAYDSERENRVRGNVVLRCGKGATAAGTHTKGIVINDGCIRMRVAGNWVDDAAEEGIYDQGMGGGIASVGNQGGNGRIVNNVVLRSGGTTAETGDGIVLGNGHGDTGGVIVAHNTIIGSSEGVGVDNNRDVGTHEIRNNIVLGHSTAISTNGNETVSNNRTTGTVADAGFVDEATDDYHLDVGSPCIDAGVDVSAYVSVDFDGVSRPQGAGWDQGAFERVVGGFGLAAFGTSGFGV